MLLWLFTDPQIRRGLDPVPGSSNEVSPFSMNERWRSLLGMPFRIPVFEDWMRTILTRERAEWSLSQFQLACACDRQGKITSPMTVIAECDKEAFNAGEIIKEIRYCKVYIYKNKETFFCAKHCYPEFYIACFWWISRRLKGFFANRWWSMRLGSENRSQ